MKRTPLPLATASVCVGLFTLAAGAAWVSRPVPSPTATTASAMANAANRLLAGLTPDRKAKATFALAGKEREDWRFVPGDHHGLTMADMAEPDRIAARDLLRTAMSSRGMLKVEAIMAMESVLRDLEKGNPTRDPMKYSIAIFGTPDKAAAWAWHLEGHHLSINFSCAKGEVVSVTPYFLGSNPGEVRTGPTAGRRILAAEEELGRELVTSFSADQRAKAIISAQAPSDVLTIPGRPIDGMWPEPAVGLLASELSPDQRHVFDELLAEFIHNLRGPLADAEMGRIATAGVEKVRFCWAGSLDKGKGHYYRIVGPTFAIEYDNTQNDANHVHTVWHDRTRDFGGDALADHIKGDHAQSDHK